MAGAPRSDMAQGEPPSSTTSTMAVQIDPPLHLFGFHYDHISPNFVSGHIEVTDQCCQSFKVLHGGVSALIAEATASLGGQLASEPMTRIAGVQLSINHLKAAVVGDVVSSEARPVFSGKSVQVWEVNLWRTRPAKEQVQKELIASSLVTLRAGLRVANDQQKIVLFLKKHSKL